MFSLERIFLFVSIVDVDSLSSLLSTALLRLLFKTLSAGGAGGAVGVTGIDFIPTFVCVCVSGSSGIESRRSSSYLKLEFN